jgi:ferredoxin
MVPCLENEGSRYYSACQGKKIWICSNPINTSALAIPSGNLPSKMPPMKQAGPLPDLVRQTFKVAEAEKPGNRVCVYTSAGVARPLGDNDMSHTINDECVLCGACLEECPEEAISEGDPKYIIDPAKCTDCGNCAEVCPTDACEPGDA